jgi:hypothetical protein
MQTLSPIEASRSPAAGVLPEPVIGRGGGVAPSATTPLFTRHMRGAIEAERDRHRLRRRDGHSTLRYRSAGDGGVGVTDAPSVAAVIRRARVVTQASPDVDRWTDEGGSFDAEAVASLRTTQTRR